MKTILLILIILKSNSKIRVFSKIKFDRVNLLHADDLVEAIIMCLKKAVNGIYNIRGPFDYSVLEIAEICAQVTGGSLHVQQDKQDKGKLLFDLNGDAALQDIGYKGSIDLVDGLGKIHNSGN